MRFAVQTLIGTKWENTWTENNRRLTFKSRKQAEEALNDFIQATVRAVKRGDMPEPYSASDFRIKEV